MVTRSLTGLGALLALALAAGCASGAAPVAPAMLPTATAPGTGFPPPTAGRRIPVSVDPGHQTRMPVDLPTVLRLASGRSYDVRIVREEMRAAHREAAHAGQWLVPSARVGFRYNRIDGNVQSTEGRIVDVDKENTFGGARVRLDWEIGDGIYNALAARQRAGARQAQVCAGVNDAVLRAGEAYLDLVRAQTAAEIAGQSVALYEAAVEETSASTEAGEGFKGDVLTARSRLAHARVQQQRAMGAAAVAAVRLRELLDLPPSVEVYATEPQPVPLELIDASADGQVLVAEALRARPELRAASHLTRAAQADHNKTSTGELFPDVRVDYTEGGYGNTFDDLGSRSDVGVGVEWTVGRGGIGDRARVSAAAARARRARLREQQLRQQIVREVSAAQAQAQAAQAAIDAGRSGVADAEEALGLYQQRQKLGVGQPLEAVLAEEVLTRSRIDLLDAMVDFNKSQLRLLRAVGRRN